MTEEKAIELARVHLANDKVKTVCVTSDGGVYIDNDVEKMKAHAKANKLEVFVLKDDDTQDDKDLRDAMLAEKADKAAADKAEKKKKEDEAAIIAAKKLKEDKKAGEKKAKADKKGKK